MNKKKAKVIKTQVSKIHHIKQEYQNSRSQVPPLLCRFNLFWRMKHRKIPWKSRGIKLWGSGRKKICMLLGTLSRDRNVRTMLKLNKKHKPIKWELHKILDRLSIWIDRNLFKLKSKKKTQDLIEPYTLRKRDYWPNLNQKLILCQSRQGLREMRNISSTWRIWRKRWLNSWEKAEKVWATQDYRSRRV